jgi:hypothetical protein
VIYAQPNLPTLIPSTDILEFSGIAWPNPGMWNPVSARQVQRNADRMRHAAYIEEDAHAHSPTRTSGWPSLDPSNNPMNKGRTFSGHPAQSDNIFKSSWTMGPPLKPNGSTLSSFKSSNGEEYAPTKKDVPDDPFLDTEESRSNVRYGKRSDISMPDYVSSSTDETRAYSNMTGLSYEVKERKLADITTTEADLRHFVSGLSPEKKHELLVVALTPPRASLGHAATSNETQSSAYTANEQSNTATKNNTPQGHQVVDAANSANAESFERKGDSPHGKTAHTGDADLKTSAQAPDSESTASFVRCNESQDLAWNNQSLAINHQEGAEALSQSDQSIRVTVSNPESPARNASGFARSRSCSAGSKRKRSCSISPEKLGCLGATAVS